MNYYVVAIRYSRTFNELTGQWRPAAVEAIVDPDISRTEVVSRIRSGEYRNISFIHKISMGELPEDVTAELLAEAEQREDA